MTIRNLEGFFAPDSIAVIGPCRHPGVLTRKLIDCLHDIAAGHRVCLVGIEDDVSFNGTRAASLDDLDRMPDLVIYLAAAELLPETITKLGAGGTKAVLIPSPGYETWPEPLMQACRDAARATNLRMLGPGSLGFSVPSTGLNALLSAEPATKGDVAFFSRSSAVLNATLSWAKTHSTGFSAVVSLGARMDMDIGDLIDYFAQDYRTRSIVLHLEGIADPRKFISAARAAARSKPVIVIRSGKVRDTGGTGRTHAGRLARTDLVYETVFRRTGLLRVEDLDEMFEALETLSHIRVPRCDKFAVISNGRSLASLAADRLMDLGGRFAELNEETRAALKDISRNYSVLDATRAAKGSVILRESVSTEEITDAITTVLKDPEVDGAVVLQAASAFQPLTAIAKAIGDAANADRKRTGRRKALVAGLPGSDGAIRAELAAAKVPNYNSPAEAARSLMHLAHDAQAREFLMAVPPSLPSTFTPDSARARSVVEAALNEGRSWLDPSEVCQVLEAYDLPIMATEMASTPEEAAEASRRFFENAHHCVVKLISPDLPFKSRIDGVRLGVEDPEAVREAAEELISKTRQNYPDAEIAGVSIHPMLEDRHGLELYMGLAETSAFGPVLVFGHGGTSIEESVDIALELPPLDLNLAKAQIGRTRIARLLDGGPSRPALDRDALAEALVKLSQITIDLPEIRELDINPMVALPNGMIALDARMTLCHPEKRPGRAGSSRLAIAPYPQEWEQTLTLKDDWSVFVRPIRPEDEELVKAFFESVTPEDLRLRFFAPVRDFSHRFLARLTQLDYARAMAFAAIDPNDGKLLGVVRLHADPDHQTGEYAVIVRSDLKGRGLGWALMKLIIRYAKADGIATIKGEVLKENTSMISVCQALGFQIGTSPDDPGIALVTLPVTGLTDEV
ncbi:bifunctional acetate--CoA ligase family protein/GNAT family N-acetyltransferase [Roseibium aggregatum]|uniref:Bifunctional acetate--CoA ligase family protein/GNAT family N-acetyltransferase n=1 Tax=Roseibium aggregatum TaxID=187304 RepID=A0A939IYI2_9HYPH|nr:GNAT family N-acetyltransferase [Roseibium aggregatum]MBN9668996.1 bifunctional acetate--CoA ligase family protein/GNAT family N-acetyltransferase [Roseibium aggregatum]